MFHPGFGLYYVKRIKDFHQSLSHSKIRSGVLMLGLNWSGLVRLFYDRLDQFTCFVFYFPYAPLKGSTKGRTHQMGNSTFEIRDELKRGYRYGTHRGSS